MKKLWLAVNSVLWLCLLLVSNQLQAQYNSLFWKISGNGLKQPSYLYGTMHTSDKRITQKGDSVVPYIKSSKAFAMELNPKEALDLNLFAKLMMGKDYSLKKSMPEREYHVVDSLVTASLGVSLKLLDNIAPVFVLTVLQASTAGLEETKDKGGEVLDLGFHKKALDAKKKVIGIETTGEQLDALMVLTYEEQIEMLVKEVKGLDSGTSSTAATDLLNFYLSEDLDGILKMEVDTTMPPKMYKALVTDRNVRMADRIGVFIKKQPTFIAIGALHLPGVGGVIELLRKQGYTVEAVKERQL